MKSCIRLVTIHQDSVISTEKVPRLYGTAPRYINQFRVECFFILFINMSSQASSCEFQAWKKENAAIRARMRAAGIAI